MRNFSSPGLAAGPYIGFALSGTVTAEADGEEEKEDLEIGSGDDDDFKSLDFGVNVEAGAELNKIMLNVFYSLGLANIANDGGQDIDISASHGGIFGVKVGYRILNM